MSSERCTNVDYLLAKAGVIRAMCERVQPCHDPPTEFAFLRENLGVSRFNHILRVHGDTILKEQSAAAVDDEIGQRSLERLFPGFTEDTMTHAIFSASQSGLGFTRVRDIAALVHLGALIAACDPRRILGFFFLSRWSTSTLSQRTRQR